MSTSQDSQNTSPQAMSSIKPKKKLPLVFFTCHSNSPSDQEPLSDQKTCDDSSMLWSLCSSSALP